MNNNVILNKRGKEFESLKNKYNKDDKGLEKLLKKFISNDEKAIQKLEKSKAEGIEFKGNVIRLYENSYDLIKDGNDWFIRFRNPQNNEDMVLSFYGENHQKRLADKFIKSKKAETEIVRKGNDYYLQYIYRQEVEIPEVLWKICGKCNIKESINEIKKYKCVKCKEEMQIKSDESVNPVGIDVNIINLACYVGLENGNIKAVRFFSGRQMRKRRERMWDIRKRWAKKLKHKKYGGKGRSYKWYREKVKSQRENHYVKYNIHNVTTKIVQEIKDRFEKPVIVLENLTDIRTKTDREIKVALKTLEGMNKKSKKYIREHRKLTADFNKWNFSDFQSFLEYKAKWMGIPVVYVPSKDTSIKCNRCGHTEQDNYKDLHELKFKCRDCGYECNADFNAGLNIARELKSSE